MGQRRGASSELTNVASGAREKEAPHGSKKERKRDDPLVPASTALPGVGPLECLTPSGPSGPWETVPSAVSQLFDDMPPWALPDRFSHLMVVDRGHTSMGCRHGLWNRTSPNRH